MPSFLVGNRSGGDILVSGNPWSGTPSPRGGIQLRAGPYSGNLSGNIYIAFSGGMTNNSGGLWLSGGGLLDGMPLANGDTYFVPKIALLPYSGSFVALFAECDSTVSGTARVSYEVF